MNQYVLITAARNEELYIEKALHSIVEQTLEPLKWVIVNDASNSPETLRILEIRCNAVRCYRRPGHLCNPNHDIRCNAKCPIH